MCVQYKTKNFSGQIHFICMKKIISTTLQLKKKIDTFWTKKMDRNYDQNTSENS